MIALSTSGPDTPLPFGHFEAPFSGGGSAVARDALKKNGKRGAFSGRRRTVLLPDIPLSLVKKIKVRLFFFIFFWHVPDKHGTTIIG